MIVHTALTRLLRSDGPLVVVECRRCGTTIAPQADDERMFDALTGGQLP